MVAMSKSTLRTLWEAVGHEGYQGQLEPLPVVMRTVWIIAIKISDTGHLLVVVLRRQLHRDRMEGRLERESALPADRGFFTQWKSSHAAVWRFRQTDHLHQPSKPTIVKGKKYQKDGGFCSWPYLTSHLAHLVWSGEENENPNEHWLSCLPVLLTVQRPWIRCSASKPNYTLKLYMYVPLMP